MMPAASVPIITIDGPSSSGKGTIARAVARALDWHLLDSGALACWASIAAWRACFSAARDNCQKPILAVAPTANSVTTVIRANLSRAFTR